MNTILQDYARTWLKENLAKLPEQNQLFVVRVYSFGDQSLTYSEVVDKLDVYDLDRLMDQVNRTLIKNV